MSRRRRRRSADQDDRGAWFVSGGIVRFGSSCSRGSSCDGPERGLDFNRWPWPALAGVIQLVECQLPKLDVAGSSPVARSFLQAPLEAAVGRPGSASRIRVFAWGSKRGHPRATARNVKAARAVNQSACRPFSVGRVADTRAHSPRAYACREVRMKGSTKRRWRGASHTMLRAQTLRDLGRVQRSRLAILVNVSCAWPCW